MDTTLSKALVFLFCTSTALLGAGCAMTPSSGLQTCNKPVSPRVMAEGAGVGALGGAAAGAGIGQLAGGKPGKGAAIGAAVGALAGLAYALKVESDYADAQCKELSLDQAIAYVRDLNQRIGNYNNSLETYVSQLRWKLAAASTSKRAKAQWLQNIAQERYNLQRAQQGVVNATTKTEQYLAGLRSAQSPNSPQGIALEQEKRLYEQQLVRLRAGSQALAELAQHI